ncbi:hypothetical protein [Kitasatospora indigofera]
MIRRAEGWWKELISALREDGADPVADGHAAVEVQVKVRSFSKF